MRRSIFTVSLAVVLLAAGSVLADWNVGDPYKTVNPPQLPKVDDGWDVMSQYYVSLADDFKCSQTGYIDDIHVWVSYMDDQLFDPTTLHLAIYSDDPILDDPTIPNYDPVTEPYGEDPNNDFSKPREQLWHGDTDFDPTMRRWWADGTQGWYDPRPGGEVIPGDHVGVH